MLPALTEAWERAATERVELACAGGHGRTGTALACLAILNGVSGTEAVAFVREHYDPHAVETPGQRRYVARWPGKPSASATPAIQNLPMPPEPHNDRRAPLIPVSKYTIRRQPLSMQ